MNIVTADPTTPVPIPNNVAEAPVTVKSNTNNVIAHVVVFNPNLSL